MKGVLKVVKAPEVIGVSKTTLNQMIGVQFIPSRLPAVAYLGSRALPRGITKGELGEGLAYFTGADDFYVISISRLCDAVQSRMVPPQTFFVGSTNWLWKIVRSISPLILALLKKWSDKTPYGNVRGFIIVFARSEMK